MLIGRCDGDRYEQMIEMEARERAANRTAKGRGNKLREGHEPGQGNELEHGHGLGHRQGL